MRCNKKGGKKMKGGDMTKSLNVPNLNIDGNGEKNPNSMNINTQNKLPGEPKGASVVGPKEEDPEEKEEPEEEEPEEEEPEEEEPEEEEPEKEEPEKEEPEKEEEDEDEEQESNPETKTKEDCDCSKHVLGYKIPFLGGGRVDGYSFQHDLSQKAGIVGGRKRKTSRKMKKRKPKHLKKTSKRSHKKKTHKKRKMMKKKKRTKKR
jgi:hypothetical protein